MADQGVSRRQTLAMAATAAGGLTGCLGYLPVNKGVSGNDGATTIHLKPGGESAQLRGAGRRPDVHRPSHRFRGPW